LRAFLGPNPFQPLEKLVRHLRDFLICTLVFLVYTDRAVNPWSLELGIELCFAEQCFGIPTTEGRIVSTLERSRNAAVWQFHRLDKQRRI
jgi:hypothetical protein